jgi:hypothetical protein
MVGRTISGDDDVATPLIVSESSTHIVIASEVPKSALVRHKRLLESLLAVARGFESLMAVAQEQQRGEGDDS